MLHNVYGVYLFCPNKWIKLMFCDMIKPRPHFHYAFVLKFWLYASISLHVDNYVSGQWSLYFVCNAIPLGLQYLLYYFISNRKNILARLELLPGKYAWPCAPVQSSWYIPTFQVVLNKLSTQTGHRAIKTNCPIVFRRQVSHINPRCWLV